MGFISQLWNMLGSRYFSTLEYLKELKLSNYIHLKPLELQGLNSSLVIKICGSVKFNTSCKLVNVKYVFLILFCILQLGKKKHFVLHNLKIQRILFKF